jgi:cyclophilin family peptidyl-prolyl cis-trans isomerase
MKRQPFGRIERLETRQALAVDVVSGLPDVKAAPGAAPAVISLAGRYDDADVGGTVVRFDVNAPAPDNRVFVELFDKAAPGRSRVTPVTTTNFLKYVDGGHYANTFIHRSVPGFVVQGGGFKVTGTTSVTTDDTTSFGTIVNEPGPVGSTNVRGTIAMAKLGGNANSASNQWFFNLADNVDPLNPNSLDNQNGGFTTFGRVLGGGMKVVDAIAALQRYDLSGNGPDGVFAATPLRDIPNPVPQNFSLAAANFVSFPAISRVGELTYSVTSSAPALVAPTIQPDGSLRLVYTPGAIGTAIVTVRVTSVFDPTRFVEDPFSVTVAPPIAPLPNAIIGQAGESEFVISRSTGTSFATTPLATLPAGTPWATAVVGDFNGDGRSDVASQTNAGAWWVSLTPASGTGTPTPWATLASFQFPTVGDFNGDGRSDIAVRNAANGNWRVLTSSGTAFSSTQWGNWASAATWDNVRAGDFNGDGKSDLVGQRTSDGAWHVSLSTGSSFTTSAWAYLSSNQFATVGDYNGDGRSDVAVRNAANGNWRVLTSSGTAFSHSQWGNWASTATWDNVRAGDFNGDGRSDLVGQRTGDGAWYVSLSTGTAFSSSVWAYLSSGQFATVGDYNGDGKSDVAVRNAPNGNWRVLASNGTAFTSAQWGNWTTSKAWFRAFAARA